MSLAVVATVSCEVTPCRNRLVVDESPLHARNAAMVARDAGWHSLRDRDICPECWTRLTEQSEQGSFELEVVA